MLRKQGDGDREHPMRRDCWMHLKEERYFYGSSGARSEKPHEEDLHPGSHTGKCQSAAGCMGATLGPQQLLNSWPPSWHTTTPPAQQTNRTATDKTNWVGSKEVKQGETRDQEKLSLLAHPGSRLMTLQLRHQI